MSYIENPKTKGSGIICCIPHSNPCTIGCEDCFFNSGRSYLEPLSDNLPNMPSLEEAGGRIVRVNDGNDSSIDLFETIKAVVGYKDRFYNTSIPNRIDCFDGPVVLTVNPGKQTDKDIHKPYVSCNNLMFVRVRVNTWNLHLVEETLDFYNRLVPKEENKVPVVLTFMAYYSEESIPLEHRKNYIYRKRTLNSYYAITTDAWKTIMNKYEETPFIYSCGKVEGERGKTGCKYCGNCLREYYRVKEKLRSIEGLK
jgi:hypothetical protein